MQSVYCAVRPECLTAFRVVLSLQNVKSHLSLAPTDKDDGEHT
jgi:hypothetical protein